MTSPPPLDRLLSNAAHGFGQQLARDLAPTAEAGDSDDSADKSIGEVYRDRNLLAFALARSVADLNGVQSVGTYEHDEWAVVAVRLPSGPVSWHVRPETVPDWIPERDPSEWFDGHDRAEKNERVEDYADSRPQSDRDAPPTGVFRLFVRDKDGNVKRPGDADE